MSKESKELKGLTIEQLNNKEQELRHGLFTLRLQSRTSHIKDNSQFVKLRKGIARILTIKKQKEAEVNQ